MLLLLLLLVRLDASDRECTSRIIIKQKWFDGQFNSTKT